MEVIAADGIFQTVYGSSSICSVTSVCSLLSLLSDRFAIGRAGLLNQYRER